MRTLPKLSHYPGLKVVVIRIACQITYTPPDRCIEALRSAFQLSFTFHTHHFQEILPLLSGFIPAWLPFFDSCTQGTDDGLWAARSHHT